MSFPVDQITRSSANWDISLFIISLRSDKYILNSRGLRGDPWGTHVGNRM